MDWNISICEVYRVQNKVTDVLANLRAYQLSDWKDHETYYLGGKDALLSIWCEPLVFVKRGKTISTANP